MSYLPGYDSWLERPYSDASIAESAYEKYDDYLYLFWVNALEEMERFNKRAEIESDEHYNDVHQFVKDALPEPLDFDEWSFEEMENARAMDADRRYDEKKEGY